MTNLFSFIIVLGILVTVHELGHFTVAKLLKMGVERFSIGFPPKMFGFTKGETEYCVSWIPLGGYVKLMGENPDEPVDDPDDPRLFSTRGPGQKAAVIMAGPIMNLVLAFAIMPLVFLIGVPEEAFRTEPVRIGYVQAESPAAAAGLQIEDRITAVEGIATGTWEEFNDAVRGVGSGLVKLSVEGPAGRRTLSLDLDQAGPDEPLGLAPHIAPVIGGLTPGFPASKAGLEEGDRIVSLDGKTMNHWYELSGTIHGSAGRAIEVVVDRNGELLDFQITPELDKKQNVGLMGIVPRTDTVVKRYPLGDSIVMGAKRNMELLVMTFGFLGDLLTLNTSIKNLGGPIMIFQVTGQAAKAGFTQFLHFMAFLSLQLGVLNLLPIPVLDGGHLVFLGIEGASGRPVRPELIGLAQRVGFVLLMGLILVISYNDIMRIFTG
jgi:regulator of sigma E protease